MLIVPLLVLLPIYLRLERGHRLRTPLALVLAFLAIVELATLSRSGLLGIARRSRRPGDPVPAVPALGRAFLVPLALVVASSSAIVVAQRSGLLRDGAPGADERRRRLDPRPPRDLRAAAAGDRPAPAVRARPEHVLLLLRVRHREVELGPALLLRRAARRRRASSARPCSSATSATCSAASARSAGSAARSRLPATRPRPASGRSAGG